MGYRKEYERVTGKKVPRSFTIHHINHNRADGDVLNLVALPSSLHVKYHQLYPKIMLTDDVLMAPVNTDEIIDVVMAAERLVEFAKIRQQVVAWVNFRNFLLRIEDKKHKGIGY